MRDQNKKAVCVFTDTDGVETVIEKAPLLDIAKINPDDRGGKWGDLGGAIIGPIDVTVVQE